MSIWRIRDIVPGIGSVKMNVRVSRMWRGKIVRPVEKPNGLGCILIDEYGDSIHAMVEEADVDDVLSNIREGCVYEISKFRIKPNQPSYKIVPHRAQLQFSNKTVFVDVSEEFKAIPIHSFDLKDYSELPPRIDEHTVLTDIIGLIKLYTRNATVKGKLVKTLLVLNTRNEELEVKLWGNLARDFAEKILRLPSPSVIVITSAKVSNSKYSDNIVIHTSVDSCVLFNPDIPEVQEYKTRFSGPQYAPKLVKSLRQEARLVGLDASQRINISDLISKDPDKNKDSVFICRAKITKITKITIGEGWNYLGCPNCNKKLQRSPIVNDESDCVLNICPEHGEQVGVPIYKVQIRLEDEDGSVLATLMGKPAEIIFEKPCRQLVDEGFTDKTVIPKVILDTRHKNQIWQLRFCSRNNFVVKAVYPDTEEVGQGTEGTKSSEKLLSKRKSRSPKESSLIPFLESAKRTKRYTETEPAMLKSIKDLEAAEATPPATNGNSLQFFGGPVESSPQWKHDVFLSFMGEDTRKGFRSHLSHELKNIGIRTFDDELGKGKDISQSLWTAIEESRFAIIVLSENYARSEWCLDELTKIFQCMEGKDTILPIFYNVDPSDVRYQKNSYEMALRKHEREGRTEKVKQWSADLTKVGNLSGWHLKNCKSERELVDDIAKFLHKELQASSSTKNCIRP